MDLKELRKELESKRAGAQERLNAIDAKLSGMYAERDELLFRLEEMKAALTALERVEKAFAEPMVEQPAVVRVASS